VRQSWHCSESVVGLGQVMRQWKAQSFLIGLSSFVASLASAQCPRYSVQIIHAPPCSVVYPIASPRAVNSLGQVAGIYQSCGGGRAWTWSSGPILVPLVMPAGGGSGCTGMNSHGQFAGIFDNAAGHQGFFYQNGVLTLLGYLPDANRAEATGINESGQVCGWTNNAVTGPLKAFLWQAGVMTEIQLPQGPNRVAYAINDRAQVVGW